jgi:hypothetical protein
VDRDDTLTPEQRAAIDASIAEGLENFQDGRSLGPFPTAEAAIRALKRATS